MFARIATFHADPSQLDAIAEHFRVEATRVFGTRDGFLGYRAFIDRTHGKMIGVSRWQTLAALQASSEPGRGIIEGASQLGASLIGEPHIFEQAFDVLPCGSANAT